MNIAEDLKALRERAGLSRDKLAKRAGMGRGTSLQRYEDPDYMCGRLLPVEIAAKLAEALNGLGQPPIERREIWALAESGGGLVVSPIAVALIPVFHWNKLRLGGAMLKSSPREESLEIAGLGTGDFAAFRLEDDHAERVAPRGSHVILDLSDKELREGRRYAILIDGQAMIRRWNPNPERWESEAATPEATIYPREAVQVIGRVVRTVKEW